MNNNKEQIKEKEVPEIVLPMGFRNQFLKFLKEMKKKNKIEFVDFSFDNSHFFIFNASDEDLEKIYNYQDELLGINVQNV